MNDASTTPTSKLDASPPAGIDQHREPYGNPESVKVCLDIAQRLLSEQRARGRHIDTRTGSTAGFCATVLALNITLGSDVLDRDLARGASVLMDIFFLIAAAAFTLAVLVSTVALAPMGQHDLSEEAIDAYSSRPKVVTPPDELRMTWLVTVTTMTDSARRSADRKAALVKPALVLFTLGLVALLAEAITFTFGR